MTNDDAHQVASAIALVGRHLCQVATVAAQRGLPDFARKSWITAGQLLLGYGLLDGEHHDAITILGHAADNSGELQNGAEISAAAQLILDRLIVLPGRRRPDEPTEH